MSDLFDSCTEKIYHGLASIVLLILGGVVLGWVISSQPTTVLLGLVFLSGLTGLVALAWKLWKNLLADTHGIILENFEWAVEQKDHKLSDEHVIGTLLFALGLVTCALVILPIVGIVLGSALATSSFYAIFMSITVIGVVLYTTATHVLHVAQTADHFSLLRLGEEVTYLSENWYLY